jgi:hypothetical protein
VKAALDFLLRVGLATTSLAAIAYAIRALISIPGLDISWDYRGLIAAYLGPLAFAGAIFLNGRADAREIPKVEDTDA